ncbi:MAG: carboxypeptidase-like regulatory domain-containing protein [Minisyncoccia bacterium]
MINTKIFLRTFFYHWLIALAVFAFSMVILNGKVFASETNGTIDSTHKYAWAENLGWINFGCDNCGVAVTDSAITGYAWSSNFGWINLNPTTAGVSNTSGGILSGHAWSSNLGWIDFTGVTINTSGEFLGYATVDSSASQISFNCVNGLSCASSDFKVKTDWRPASVRASGEVAGASSGSIARNSSALPPILPTLPAFLPPIISPIVNPVPVVLNNLPNILNRAADLLSFFFGGKNTPLPVPIVSVPKLAPLSLKGGWNILPEQTINSFVFAPLPYEIRILAGKFPELEKTLQAVGVERFNDISKLAGVNLNVPGLTDILDETIKKVGLEEISDIENISGVALDIPGLSSGEKILPNTVGLGNIALIPGLPISNFSLSAKQNLPTEFVFARAAGELVDLNVDLSVGERGDVMQRISLLPGTTMKLVVKPMGDARNVTGYVVFKSTAPKVVTGLTPRSLLTASALFSMDGLVEKTSDAIPVEKNLVLSSFKYEDTDRDGIYTADITTPVVPGEYEIITVIDYIDPVLGSRRMSMVTVIDPEGYVFEKRDGKETRIPSAIISLYRLNPSSKAYELWNAKEYSQDNPQITDIRGTYSFLVPEGSYYFHVEAPGYNSYEGKVFIVAEGAGVHQNIELKSGVSWLKGADWQTGLLIVVLLLLVYNLYRTNLRDKLSKLSNK